MSRREIISKLLDPDRQRNQPANCGTAALLAIYDGATPQSRELAHNNTGSNWEIAILALRDLMLREPHQAHMAIVPEEGETSPGQLISAIYRMTKSEPRNMQFRGAVCGSKETYIIPESGEPYGHYFGISSIRKGGKEIMVVDTARAIGLTSFSPPHHHSPKGPQPIFRQMTLKDLDEKVLWPAGAPEDHLPPDSSIVAVVSLPYDDYFSFAGETVEEYQRSIREVEQAWQVQKAASQHFHHIERAEALFPATAVYGLTKKQWRIERRMWWLQDTDE